jgi:hypothetical protein
VKEDSHSGWTGRWGQPEFYLPLPRAERRRERDTLSTANRPGEETEKKKKLANAGLVGWLEPTVPITQRRTPLSRSFSPRSSVRKKEGNGYRACGSIEKQRSDSFFIPLLFFLLFCFSALSDKKPDFFLPSFVSDGDRTFSGKRE